VVSQKFNYSSVIPGDPAKAGGDPESRNLKAFWMPVFTGMTVKTERLVK
jgi:hypothetical protein